MLLDQSWSLVLSAIIGSYLNESTICIFWNDKFEFQLLQGADYASFVGINIQSLKNQQCRDVVDIGLRKKALQEKELPFDDLLLKITISIEVTHCETFVVFDEDIGQFVDAFTKASVYSIWRSLHNKFVFAHVAHELKECCENRFFEEH
ncbi:uncharacterized protein LOC128263666 [Drosophila gunungcola]|uniref:uncharacterized protein LOC128263666 n=1 Tax=Drosophila gunungcola TaxID=103775 RepID=UPI0022E0B2D9|nr:uncharacterized protein LOC128263666 [Drosophila gunungcola]